MKLDELQAEVVWLCLNSIHRYLTLDVDELRKGMLDNKTNAEFTHRYNLYHQTATVSAETLKSLLS